MSTSDTPVPPAGLTASNLTLSKEQTYFVFVLIISMLFWLAIAISIIGLLYAAIIAFFLWLGNGLLVAHLRSEAIRVDERQLPQLHAAFGDVCQQLRVPQPPALYVLQAGGLLNAFATRFVGRNFVVVFSDFLEALGPNSSEMKFVLGHELGHIKSRHILKHIFLAPGLFFPLIGPAYRRAWESSCDRYGAFASQDVDGSLRAMMVISGGREHGPQLDAGAFAGQHTDERGFFVSLHELISSYPTLSRRVSDLLALKTGEPAKPPSRSALAYFLALFIPGGNLGGGGGGVAAALIMVVVIGLLAAMAIPAFQKVREASQLKGCINNERMLSAAFDQHQLDTGNPPSRLDEIIGPEKFLPTMPICPGGGDYEIPDGAKSAQEIFCTVHGTMEDLMEASMPNQRKGRKSF